MLFTNHIPFKFIALTIVAFIVSCGDNSVPKESSAPPTEETISFSNDGLCTSGCTQDSQCNTYLKCVTGGRVGCLNGHCAGFSNSNVNFECVYETADECPSTAGTCGSVTAPPECDPNDLVCHFDEGMRPGEDQYRTWLQVTADQQGSTVTVHSLTAYCVHNDGTLTVASGTAAGGLTLEWANWYFRDTWYRAGQGHGENEIFKKVYQPGKTTYEVPLYPYLLHFGNNGGSTAGCREIVLKAVISTTGDAKVELGLDYYKGYTWSHESGVSGWKSCTSGTTTLMTPRSDNRVCEGSLGAMCSPSAEKCDGQDNDCDGQVDEDGVCNTTPPPSNGCPATGIKVAPGPTLLNSCSTLITETWGPNGQLYQSAPGQPLMFTDWWSGYAYIETVCNGTEHDSWPQVTNMQAGFSQICVQGQDVTNTTYVCWDDYKKKYRPTVPLSLSGVSLCP